MIGRNRESLKTDYRDYFASCKDLGQSDENITATILLCERFGIFMVCLAVLCIISAVVGSMVTKHA